MNTQQRKILTASGTPVWVSGAGPTVILVHGVVVDHRMWAAQVDALSNRYRVCCIDMLGHGEAPDPVGERSLDDFVAQLHEVVEQFSDAGPPVLGGFSMGGLVSQSYAIRHHTALSGLILMNTVYDRTPEESAVVQERSGQMKTGGVEAVIASGRERYFTEQERISRAADMKRLFGWMRDGEFSAKCKAHRVFARADAETAGKLGAISCPTLVMTGELDAGSTPRMSRNIAAVIANARLEILDQQRHMMPMLDAVRVNTILLDFLAHLAQ